MNRTDILFCILNYKETANSERLYRMISPHFDCHILDADSGERPNAFRGDTIYLPNIYLGGLINKAIELTIEGGYKYLFFFCSDVIMEESQFALMRDVLYMEDFSNVGVYCPSHKSDSYTFVKWSYNQKTGRKRSVPCIEAMLSMWHKDLIKWLYPTFENKYGWGLDICAAYFCNHHHLQQLIDDRISIYHPFGASNKNHLAGANADKYINRYAQNIEIKDLWWKIYQHREEKNPWKFYSKSYDVYVSALNFISKVITHIKYN